METDSWHSKSSLGHRRLCKFCGCSTVILTIWRSKEAHTALHQQSRWLSNGWFWHLRHNAVHYSARGNVVRGASMQHGGLPAGGWRERTSPLPSQLPDNDTPATRVCWCELPQHTCTHHMSNMTDCLSKQLDSVTLHNSLPDVWINRRLSH